MHYKNGREAHVGDSVVGNVFNNKGIKAGTLVSLTPGPDSCSAMVGFLEVKQVEGLTPSSLAYDTLVKVQGTIQHGSAGAVAVTYYKQDYTECKNLLHAEDAFKMFEKPANEAVQEE